MRTKVKIERGDDGTYGAYIENNTLPYGIIGEGNTSNEAIEDFKNSYKEMKEYYNTINKKFTESEFDFVYDLASFLSYYSKILSLSGLERITGVNQGQLSHYVTGHRKPGKKTVEKIEKNIKGFAEELKQVEFI
ncbi:helix-turn-helix transcriptional regulator [Algoriphagus sp. NG3]|uniref:helix-turn-helix domain-containing protein n=1 Tax=Algoriphagus sp. NG3 TaxID=3097546 RepID=UPI002A80C487|nr:helix-turn-helix transcriptional regulator [Algoriphagus sp. NG3]WPR77394.1 helix-turn-helix transcriptional regulator [Algoriphagus sp. NG3]